MATATRRDFNRLQRLSRALDRQLLHTIQYGRPILGDDGQPLKDATGQVLYKPPTAADFAAATRRLKQVGVKFREPVKSTRDQIIENMDAAGMKFPVQVPEVDIKTDDANPTTDAPAAPLAPTVSDGYVDELNAKIHSDPLVENIRLKQRLAQLRTARSKSG